VGVLSYVWRFVTDPITHACWAGLTGYFIGLAVSGQYHPLRVGWIGLVMASVLHGLNDWSGINTHPLWVVVVLVSAILLLGLRGINKKLPLPGPPISHFTPEDRSNGKIKMLPTSLETATERMMRAGSVAREPEVFGDDFVDHYGGTREHEVKLWNQAVTTWEVERYLELA